MAASAERWPSVRACGRGAAADESEVASAEPRTWRRRSTSTTPRRARAVTAAAAPGMMAESSATRCGPAARASSTARWRAAFFAGTKSAAAGASPAQRSSTAPVDSETRRQGSPGASRVTLTFWPGARKGRTASGSGQAYSRAIQQATSAPAASKAGGARTWETGLIFAGSMPAGASTDVAMT